MSDMDPLFPPTPAAGRAAESRTHRRSLCERPCDVLYVHAIEQVTGGGAQPREDTTAHSIEYQSEGKRRTTLSSTSCRALPRRTHTMRGILRPRVAIGLPGSGCGVSRIRPNCGRRPKSAL